MLISENAERRMKKITKKKNTSKLALEITSRTNASLAEKPK